MKFVSIVLATFISVIALSSPPAKAAPVEPSASYLTPFCCDAAGVPRCQMPIAVIDGTPCVCYGQGTGWAC